MPIKMVASRRHYVKAEGKEYDKGGTFYVADDREADRLVKMGRARRVSDKTAATEAAPAAASPDLLQQNLKAEGQPESDPASARKRYRRSDMRSEE